MVPRCPPASMITVKKADNKEEEVENPAGGESHLCAMADARSTLIVLSSVVHDQGDLS